MAEPIAPLEDCPKCLHSHTLSNTHPPEVFSRHNTLAQLNCSLCKGECKWDPAPKLRARVEALERAVEALTPRPATEVLLESAEANDG